MSIRKKIKIAAFSISGIAVLLFAVLIVHIAVMVKGRSPLSAPTIQMARIDFKQNLDPARAVSIEKRIRSLRGVKATYFNPGSHILIYTFDNRQNNSEHIYREVVKSSGIVAVRYVPSSRELASGCPVMDGNSFYGKLTDIVASVIN